MVDESKCNIKKMRDVLQEVGTEGCTMKELAEKSGCSLYKTRLGVERMIGEEHVNIREIGTAKLIKYKAKEE